MTVGWCLSFFRGGHTIHESKPLRIEIKSAMLLPLFIFRPFGLEPWETILAARSCFPTAEDDILGVHFGTLGSQNRIDEVKRIRTALIELKKIVISKTLDQNTAQANQQGVHDVKIRVVRQPHHLGGQHRLV